MRHVVIVTGGYLNIDFAKTYLKTLSYDEVFAVDKGLEYIDRLGIIPSYIVGDFDTVDEVLLNRYDGQIVEGRIDSYIERYPDKKDFTDTELAIQKALKDGAEQITLLAATGSRVDHMLANIFLLRQTARLGVECYIVDEFNRISLLDDEGNKRWRMGKKAQYGKFVSLVPISPEIKGLTMTGFLYPLSNQRVCQGSSLTISNQITADMAEITFQEGKLLIIESRD